MRTIAIVLLVPLSALAQPSASTPPDAPPIEGDAIRRELEELKAKQQELERRLEASLARPPAVSDPGGLRLRFGRGGFALGTADGKTEVRLRAVFNLDFRAYFAADTPDTFLVRRARPFIEGTLFDVIDVRIMPDFALGQPQLLDAYAELRPWQWLRLRGGRFMIPVGLEWLQKDTTITFAERSLATDLVPYRDIGVMLSGDIGGILCYALALVNGAPDGGNGPDLDPQSAKDYVARLFLRPLKRTRVATWTDLGFGVAGSYGSVKGTATSSNLPTYRSVGQQPIFTYRGAPPGAPLSTMSGAASDGGTAAAGDRWRLTPQLYWYLGPVGLLAEYVISSQRLQRLGMTADIQNQAWNLTASFVMTLERATYEGVVPRHPVDFRHLAFGAFELTMRYSELRLDDNAFPNFADPDTSVRAAREFAGGLNWYVTDVVKIMLSFHRTDFLGGAPNGGNRDAENVLFTRFQLAL